MVDYYRERASLVLQQALADAAAGGRLNATAIARAQAQHAFRWTTAQKAYPTVAAGEAVAVSEALAKKYESAFAACATLMGE